MGAEIAFCTAHYIFMAVIVSRLADLEGSVGGMYPSIQGVSLGSKEPRKKQEQVCSSSGPPEADQNPRWPPSNRLNIVTSLLEGVGPSRF